MKILKLANFLDNKYTLYKKAEDIRDNLAKRYKDFMSEVEGNGDIYQLVMIAKSYSIKAPPGTDLDISNFIKKFANDYTNFIAKIDQLDNIEIAVKIQLFINHINKIREEISDEITTTKTMMSFERKRFKSTVEKIFVGFQKFLKDQLKYIFETGLINKDDLAKLVKVETKSKEGLEEVHKRVPMQQTPNKLARLILQYGPLYGVNEREDYEKVVHKDYELAKELVSAFMGLDLLVNKDNKNLQSHVNKVLFGKIQDVLNPPKMNLPINIGPLPKRPPGK